ncbi:putative xylose-proton symporter [Diplonema papillatum]|nr:putative xylose-proton symporter [Diplonema papillatum]
MNALAQKRVEAWLEDVERSLSATPHEIQQRALTFKASELRRRKPSGRDHGAGDAAKVSKTLPPPPAYPGELRSGDEEEALSEAVDAVLLPLRQDSSFHGGWAPGPHAGPHYAAPDRGQKVVKGVTSTASQRLTQLNQQQQQQPQQHSKVVNNSFDSSYAAWQLNSSFVNNANASDNHNNNNPNANHNHNYNNNNNNNANNDTDNTNSHNAYNTNHASSNKNTTNYTNHNVNNNKNTNNNNNNNNNTTNNKPSSANATNVNSNSNNGQLVAGGSKEPAVPALSLATIFTYAAPSFALTSITMLVGVHGAFFYVGIGAHLPFYAFFTAVARSFDVVSDPVMGWATDATHPSPSQRKKSNSAVLRALAAVPVTGRRRPYMAVFCCGYAVCLVLLLSPPESLTADWGISLWFGVAYCLFYVFDTAAHVPYNSLAPELSDDPEERDRMFYYISVVRNIGIMVAVSLPVALSLLYSEQHAALDVRVYNTSQALAPGFCPRDNVLPFQYEGCWHSEDLCGCLAERAAHIDDNMAGQRKGMRAVAIVFAAEYLLSMAWCVYKIREREPQKSDPSPPVIPAMLSMFRNRPFMQLLPAWILDAMAFTMFGTMLPFFVEYVVKPWAVPECDHICCGDHSDSVVLAGCRSDLMCRSETWLGIALVALFAASVLSMPLWFAAMRRLGKRATWLVFNLLAAATNAIFVFVGAGDPIFMSLLAAVNGIPVGAQFLTETIVADIIDYDELLTGRRAEAKFMVFQTFIPKIVSIPAQTVPLALLSAFNFVTPCEDGPHHPQPSSVRLYMKGIFYFLPAICALASFAIKRKFPLTDDMMHKVRDGCALSMKGKPSRDPITGRIRRPPGYAKDPEVLANAVWKLDCFFGRQLELFRKDVREGGPAGRLEVARGLKTQFYYGVTGCAASFAAGVASLGLGLIHDPITSWLPTLSVTLLAGFAVASVVARYRMAAADELLDDPTVWNTCRAVLDELIEHREGVDAKHAHDAGWFAPSWDHGFSKRDCPSPFSQVHSAGAPYSPISPHQHTSRPHSGNYSAATSSYRNLASPLAFAIPLISPREAAPYGGLELGFQEVTDVGEWHAAADDLLASSQARSSRSRRWSPIGGAQAQEMASVVDDHLHSPVRSARNLPAINLSSPPRRPAFGRASTPRSTQQQQQQQLHNPRGDSLGPLSYTPRIAASPQPVMERQWSNPLPPRARSRTKYTET